MKAGRELDALIAEKVMGWRWTDGAWSIPEGAEQDSGVPPPYSTDIAAAFEVVEKLKRQSAAIQITMDGKNGDWCRVHVSHANGIGSATVEADTAPLAICLAALRVMGIEG